MFRRTVHRGTAALVLVAVLAFAGAQPAAAANLRFADRLAGLWSAVTGGEPAGLWNKLIGWFAEPEKTPPVKSDTGWGSDPNGYITNPLPSNPALNSQAEPNG